jgi:hypothetical protein
MHNTKGTLDEYTSFFFGIYYYYRFKEKKKKKKRKRVRNA